MPRKRLTESDVCARVAVAAEKAGSYHKLAAEWGCSAMHLHDVVHGKRSPGPLVLDRLGLRRVETVHYERAES